MKNDIRLVIGFHRHLKIRKLHKTLGADGVLSLLLLWTYAAENRTSGRLHGLDDRDIADASEWKGTPRKLIRTLVSIGLLDEMSDGTMKIHDWEQHQPWIFHSEARSEKARASACARWGTAPIKDNPDAERMPDASETHKERNAPAPAPAPDPSPDPDPSLKNKDQKHSSSGDDPPPPNGFSPEDMARIWNEEIDLYDYKVLIPKVLKLTADRKKKAAARIRDCEIDEAKWRRILDNVHNSPFLSGEKPGKGHDGWRATFDFVVKSELSITKILEEGFA